VQFNSFEFPIFFLLVILVYWFLLDKKVRYQNAFLLGASYIFYGWWNRYFLLLIIASSLVDFTIGLQLGKSDNPARRKFLLWLSILFNLGILGLFKYYNFFVESFIDLFNNFGVTLNASTLNIILPVGISFYTFQTMSYTIDIYRKQLEPTKDIIVFFAFVSFFPQLVAGPIERAKNLLPQFERPRIFNKDQVVDGLRQILWGLFKKVVIADRCAVLVDTIFENPEIHSGSTLLLGAVFFAFQIYGDFSGYSDIAIGTAKILGFDLMKNFDFPYFSRNIAEFWRRWHISLSTWFRDYLYIPLGGSRGGKAMRIRNTFAIFLVSGFWHGANWTFIVWGAIHAMCFLPLLLLNKNRNYLEVVAKNSLLPSFKELGQMLVTFIIATLAWVFFRATSIEQAVNYIQGIFDSSLFSVPAHLQVSTIAFIIFGLIVEWFNRDSAHGLQQIGTIPKLIRRPFYYLLLVIMFFYGAPATKEFIYFQF